MTPLLTQSLTLSTVGPLAMSGRLVPASTLIASWFASRTVVRCTVMPVLVWNGASTSWNAFSSAPPQALQTVTSVEDAPVFPFEPPPHAASKNSAPRQSATARERRLPKTSAMLSSLHRPRPGRRMPPSCCLLPGPSGARVRRQTESLRHGYGYPRRTFALVNDRILVVAWRLVNLRLGVWPTQPRGGH